MLDVEGWLVVGCFIAFGGDADASAVSIGGVELIGGSSRGSMFGEVRNTGSESRLMWSEEILSDMLDADCVPPPPPPLPPPLVSMASSDGSRVPLKSAVSCRLDCVVTPGLCGVLGV